MCLSSLFSLLAILHALRQLIDPAKLPRPLHVVQELAVVEAVVIRRVALRVVGWRQSRLLVPIYGIVEEETLDLLGNLQGSEPAQRPGLPVPD